MLEVSMSSPDLTDLELTAVAEVVRGPVLSIGPQLAAFEQAIASYTATPYAVGVNSGTSGLHLCVIAAGVEEGDLVITTPFSFIASANTILYERATPVFVDVDPATGNIDPALVAQAANDLCRGGTAARAGCRRPSVICHLSPAIRRPFSPSMLSASPPIWTRSSPLPTGMAWR